MQPNFLWLLNFHTEVASGFYHMSWKGINFTKPVYEGRLVPQVNNFTKPDCSMETPILNLLQSISQHFGKNFVLIVWNRLGCFLVWGYGASSILLSFHFQVRTRAERKESPGYSYMRVIGWSCTKPWMLNWFSFSTDSVRYVTGPWRPLEASKAV